MSLSNVDLHYSFHRPTPIRPCQTTVSYGKDSDKTYTMARRLRPYSTALWSDTVSDRYTGTRVMN